LTESRPADAQVIIHGCRSNLAEHDALAAVAPAGSTVINSCAVTAEAVRHARAAARRAVRAGGRVFVTGCAATLDAGRFSDLAEVIPNARKFQPQSWGRSGPAPAVASRRSRGFLAIQDGCDHDCTFCVTRLARGASRSTPVVEILARVREFCAAGVTEIVLTGIDATSYGNDLPERPTLGLLVQAILDAVPELPRLRLSSLDAAEADDRLIAAFANPRLMPQVHLSLQSGDDLILKRMKRRHSRAQALALIARLRAVRPDIAIGADLNAGFPTESAEAHGNSLSLIAEAGLVQAHVFPFSPRPQTAAARMPQVLPEIARARAAELRALADRQNLAFQASRLHRLAEVVSEGASGHCQYGL
jgi:threonylcarbamoyladenosine tRNA methylthiotransferase MtaB